MQLQQVRRSLATVLVALVAGALGGYLAGLVRPRPARAYASDYTAPHPDLVALRLEPGEEPAVGRAPLASGGPVEAPRHDGAGEGDR